MSCVSGGFALHECVYIVLLNIIYKERRNARAPGFFQSTSTLGPKFGFRACMVSPAGGLVSRRNGLGGGFWAPL